MSGWALGHMRSCGKTDIALARQDLSQAPSVYESDEDVWTYLRHDRGDPHSSDIDPTGHVLGELVSDVEILDVSKTPADELPPIQKRIGFNFEVVPRCSDLDGGLNCARWRIHKIIPQISLAS